jgi:hypothetical protein
MTRWVVIALVVLARVAHAQDADDKARSTQMFERGRVDVVQRDDYATACELFVHSYELDPAPGTALNLGDCNEHLGHLTHAMKWFQRAEQTFAAAHDSEREAFAHARAEAVRARIAASEHPPRDRTGFRVAFWASTAIGAVGTALWIYGYNQVQDATNKLCAGGAYYGSRPECPAPSMPLTSSQVATLNAQGLHGRDLTVIGGVTAFLAGATAAVWLYEGYLRPERKRAHDVVIAPSLGGAVVMGRF